MSTGRNGIIRALAANQRDEVRDMHDVAAALGAQPGIKQQTFVAGIVSKGNGDCFLTPDCHTALAEGRPDKDTHAFLRLDFLLDRVQKLVGLAIRQSALLH